MHIVQMKIILSRSYEHFATKTNRICSYVLSKGFANVFSYLFFSGRFGVTITRDEVKRLWDTRELITDQRGYLEYREFVRTFGYSLRSAGIYLCIIIQVYFSVIKLKHYQFPRFPNENKNSNSKDL